MSSGRYAKPAIPVAFLLLSVVAGGDLQALTDEQIFRNLSFKLTNPGARTLGMGGTSVAIVSDVTAAEANPAGLNGIERLQLFGEFRSADASPVSSGGSMGSAELSSQVFPYFGFTSDASPDFAGGATYLGVAVPLSRFTLAFSRSVMLDQETVLDDASLEFALEDFPLWINPKSSGGGPALEQYRVSSTSAGRLNAELVHYSAGFSASFGTDLSIGATATLADLDMASSVANRVTDPQGYLERPINPRSDEDNDGFPDDILTLSSIDNGDSSLSYTLGLHYRPNSSFRSGSSPVGFGLAYHKGAEFDIAQSLVEIDPASGLPEPGRVSAVNTFRLPDRWSLGVVGQPAPGWLLAADVERIEYSDLLQGFEAGSDVLTSGFIDPDVLQQHDGDEPIRFDVDDAIVFRVGAEYTMVRGGWSLGFRGGFYNDPDSSIRMTSFNSDSEEINRAIVGAFGDENDENHFTAGFSVGARRGLKLHVGADFAEVSDQYLMSVVWTSAGRR